MKLLDMQGRIYSIESAYLVATELTAGDDAGWTYVVEPKDGFAKVRALDSEGNFVGRPIRRTWGNPLRCTDGTGMLPCVH